VLLLPLGGDGGKEEAGGNCWMQNVVLLGGRRPLRGLMLPPRRPTPPRRLEGLDHLLPLHHSLHYQQVFLNTTSTGFIRCCKVVVCGWNTQALHMQAWHKHALVGFKPNLGSACSGDTMKAMRGGMTPVYTRQPSLSEQEYNKGLPLGAPLALSVVHK
jgi:hypothetical protein